MITAEEFFRNKIKEQAPNREIVTLSQEVITAEQGMQWAHEFKQSHLHDVVGRSERAWVVYNINGDVIGVADSYGKALSIYEERYGDTPEHPEESINMFEVNRLHYA